MDNVMKYKGFVGSVNYGADDEVFYGKLEFISDLAGCTGLLISEVTSLALVQIVS